MKEGLNHYWSTDILKDTIKDINLLNKTTEYLIANCSDANKQSDQSIVLNLFDDKNLDDFKNKIVLPSFNNYLNSSLNFDISSCKYKLKACITGWGTGYSMAKHNHSGSQISAVFYLMAEEKTSGGALIMQDPRFNANRGYEKDRFKNWFSSLHFTPQTGDIIIFPSFVYHSVDIYYGKLRLAMPVDLFLYKDE